MTLLSVGNSEGTRRCDQRCYGASGGACECCCQSINHGAGLYQAIANTRDMAGRWIAAYEERTGAPVEFELAIEVRQRELFPAIESPSKGKSP